MPAIVIIIIIIQGIYLGALRMMYTGVMVRVLAKHCQEQK
jgi:hypothetical protein